ncbi:MAG: hypothetical protein R2769_13825 [Saprospiraceae bacterium]
MKFEKIVTILTLFSLLNSCITYEGEPNPGSVEEKKWEKVPISFERLILETRATPFYLMAITDNQFFRIGTENEILEKRILDVENGVYGKPCLADNLFVRLTKDDDGRFQLEFHLVKNSAEVLQKSIEELAGEQNEVVQPDYFARNIGAFNQDGSRFILPTVTFPNFHYTFFIFDVRLDATTFHFEKVETVNRVDIPELSSEFNNIGTIRSLGSDFYIAAKDGGFKIDKDGEYTMISSHWMKDYFSKGSNYYGVAFEDNLFMESKNQGRDWATAQEPSEVKEVSKAGGLILSQFLPGHQFSLANDSLTTIKKVKLNEEFPNDNNSYQSINYFSNNFYLSVGKDLYLSQNIVTVQ